MIRQKTLPIKDRFTQKDLQQSPSTEWTRKGAIHQMNHQLRIKEYCKQNCLVMGGALKPPGASLAPTMDLTILTHYLPIFKQPRRASLNSLRTSTITLNCLLIPILATLKTGIRMTSSRNIASSSPKDKFNPNLEVLCPILICHVQGLLTSNFSAY